MRTAALCLVVVGSLAAGAFAQEPAKEVSGPVYKAGPGIAVPVLIKEAKPVYTRAARVAGTQGKVLLAGVVLPDGTIADIKVVKSLHPDLDESAVKALKKWTFKPGTKDGQPVTVKIEVEMTFSLRSPGP
jgi:TonB family protein